MTDRGAPAAVTQFLDTNILVYVYDNRDPQKQFTAGEVLREGLRTGTSYISAQVLGEFFSAVTGRIANRLSPLEAEEAVSMLCNLPVVELDAAMVRRSIFSLQRYRISYWDALIVSAAERAGCSRILSEDLNPGQSYHGILAVNPFAS